MRRHISLQVCHLDVALSPVTRGAGQVSAAAVAPPECFTSPRLVVDEADQKVKAEVLPRLERKPSACSVQRRKRQL